MQLTKVIIFCFLHKKYTLKKNSTPAKKKGMYHVHRKYPHLYGKND